MRALGLEKWLAGAGLLAGLTAGPATAQPGGEGGLEEGPFRRVASFPVFLNTDIEQDTAAEIVASIERGTLLVCTDSLTGNLGFINIADPANPKADGVVDVGGEPTSVAVLDKYALVCVNTSADFVDTSGNLVVVDLRLRQVVATLPLGGQPDAIAISPDKRYAAIAIENERDEDLGDGEPPQAPPGFVVIVDLVGGPASWQTRAVDLVGIPTLFPDDPEPEFVDISALNVAVVTLQENNHIVLIWLPTGDVIADFSAGTVDLDGIDADEDGVIVQNQSLTGVPREPDAVAWTSLLTFATADEGDLFGGSRGFTTWTAWGTPLYLAGNTIERDVARIGHYPEDRSENKGSEPEGVEFGVFDGHRYLFVGSERSNTVQVYELMDDPILGAQFPVLRQTLPTGVGPEGLLAIPARDLLVVACEEDSRADKFRSSVMIYQRTGTSSYPTIVSDDRPGTDEPIPWAALSGLVTDPQDDGTLYAIYDGYYEASRIFSMDRTQSPARITSEIALNDGLGALELALVGLKALLPDTEDFDPSDFVDPDGTVNLDPEGVAIAPDGSFWIASEGAGNLGDGVSDPDDRPFEGPNLLVRAAVDQGSAGIEEVVLLPIELTRDQLRFGFEGVAVTDQALFVAFQRAWQNAGDPADRARIGCYDLATKEWTFAHYPLEAPTSPNGGWVGLSELTHLGGDSFAVIERDDQGGPDAAIKRIYSFSITGVEFKSNAEVASFDLLSKRLASDLLADNVYGPSAGPIPEKLEGLAVSSTGTAFVVNDNDGVEDNNGETLLIVLPGLFD